MYDSEQVEGIDKEELLESGNEKHDNEEHDEEAELDSVENVNTNHEKGVDSHETEEKPNEDEQGFESGLAELGQIKSPRLTRYQLSSLANPSSAPSSSSSMPNSFFS